MIPVKPILVAGIGNIFLGDDAFGVHAARRLIGYDLPDEVHVADFGIRGIDLAYALADGYELVILLDATKRGGAPGTLYLIEPDPEPWSRPDCRTLTQWIRSWCFVRSQAWMGTRPSLSRWMRAVTGGKTGIEQGCRGIPGRCNRDGSKADQRLPRVRSLLWIYEL